MLSFWKRSFAAVIRPAVSGPSGRSGVSRQRLSPAMVALGWPLACALAAIILWLGVQWWYIDLAGPGGTAAATVPEPQGGNRFGTADHSAQAMLAGYRKLVHQHLFIANMLLFSLGLVGMVLAARLNKRWLHAEQVRSACLKAMDAGQEGFLILRPVGGHDSRLADFIVQDCNERGAGHAGVASRDLPGRRLSELSD